MATKPIFRVFVNYIISSKKRVKKTKGIIDTFALTDDIDEIKKDKELITRICYINKRKPENVIIEITNVEVENQYGETTDRF
jgi:hypothetical protein|tara:strand:+ start:265 stop:510 length:246 start_codon:yes stop_codon:yes gene_type:complete